jgi:CheY-like chemotaxis protein
VDNSLDRSKGGLGIGLALVKSLVELHNGTIEVYSEPHQGSEFVVTLPLQRAVIDMDAQQESAIKRGYKILVVDDNTDAAKSLAIMLRYEGHETQFAFSGAAAIEVCTTFTPDVILLDIGLPEMNGYEVCKHLRGTGHCTKTCIIAMTGYDTEDYRRLSAEAGMNDHLVKPVMYRVLIEVIEKHLKGGS